MGARTSGDDRDGGTGRCALGCGVEIVVVMMEEISMPATEKLFATEAVTADITCGWVGG